MPGRSEGITLLEVVFGVFLIGLAAAFFLPGMLKRPVDHRKAFIDDLNMVVQAAWTEALETNRFQRVLIDLEKGRVVLERAKTPGFLRTLSTQAVDYEPVRYRMLKTSFAIPGQLIFRRALIEQKDYLAGEKTNQFWFYVDNHGNLQEVELQLDDEDKPSLQTFKLNPFFRRFEKIGGLYEAV